MSRTRRSVERSGTVRRRAGTHAGFDADKCGSRVCSASLRAALRPGRETA